MPKLQFWFDFGSTYSYLTAMRIGALAEASGVEVEWKPFLLGPIFKAAGWESSPFLEQPAKLQYMWRDVSRVAASRGVEFRQPEVFPANGVYASRVALVAEREGWMADWGPLVFQAVFQKGMDISRPEALAKLCRDAGQDAERVLDASSQQGIKDALRAQSELAEKAGLFGAPTFVTEDSELFWGDDRLEAALTWAKRG